MNERITNMDQISIGDVIMQYSPNGSIETMVVTTKFHDSIIEGLGFKGTEELKQRRFFLNRYDLVKIGSIDLGKIFKQYINSLINDGRRI